MRKPAICPSTITRWKTPSGLLPSARRTGYSPVPSGPVNGPPPFKRCLAPRNSTGSFHPHGLEIPWKNCPPGLTAVSMSYCRLHRRQRTLNHRAITRADLVATAACTSPKIDGTTEKTQKSPLILKDFFERKIVDNEKSIT